MNPYRPFYSVSHGRGDFIPVVDDFHVATASCWSWHTKPSQPEQMPRRHNGTTCTRKHTSWPAQWPSARTLSAGQGPAGKTYLPALLLLFKMTQETRSIAEGLPLPNQ